MTSSGGEITGFMDGISIRDLKVQDYEEIYHLWKGTKGIGLSQSDSKESILFFLERNPNLSLVAVEKQQIVATILCGHDGRRGYIHHLAVAKDYRHQGLGQRLTAMALKRLMELGIQKCHLFVKGENQKGREFWQRLGWAQREDIQLMSKTLESADEGGEEK